MPKTRKVDPPPVRIRVDSNSGSITVDPTSLQVNPKERISWMVEGDENARWLVIFEDGTAFDIRSDDPKVASHSVEVRNGQVAIPNGRKKGIFQYKVAVFVGGEIHAVMNCPEVIIK